MAQKLTLTEYLRRRGAIKALTRIEAEAFGIPWPLQSGWPAKFAGMEITAEMLADLRARMASARQSTARKARCGLENVAGLDYPSDHERLAATESKGNVCRATSYDLAERQKMLLTGFNLRRAKRFRKRRVTSS